MSIKIGFAAVCVALFGLVGLHLPCEANPDGPVGTIVLTPHYSIDNRYTVFKFGLYDPGMVPPGLYRSPSGESGSIKREWSLGLDVMVPLSTYATVGIGITGLRRPGSNGLTIPSNSTTNVQEEVFIEGIESMRLDLCVRFYIPIDAKGREALARMP